MPFPLNVTVADVSGLEHKKMWLEAPIFSVAALQDLTQSSTRKVTLHGKRHSQGGQTLLDDAVALDLDALQAIEVEGNAGASTALVECGATWDHLHQALANHSQRFVPCTHQSSPHFSIGGSLAVNCHGRDPSQPPLAGTVQALDLVLADGSTVHCNRTTHADLFAAALGGYGACGVIVRAWLALKPERQLQHHVRSGWDLAAYCAQLLSRATGESDWPAMHFAYLKFSPDELFSEVIAVDSTVLPTPPTGELRHESPLSDDGVSLLYNAMRDNPRVRGFSWALAKAAASKLLGHQERQLNAMRGPVRFSLHTAPGHTDLLQEYFLPPENLYSFLTLHARPVLERERINLVSSTVRVVQEDRLTMLSYAPSGPRASVVLNFSIAKDSARPGRLGTSPLDAWTRELINGALSCGGSFYLPYARNATPAQFRAAYPQWQTLFNIRRTYDPTLRFDNAFLRAYDL